MSNAPQEVRRLVQRFRRNQADYKNPAYNETQVRREFIDPLFKALGWDVDNEQGYAEAYKDVIHEDAIKVGGTTKAPDYCFLRRYRACDRPCGDAGWPLADTRGTERRGSSSPDASVRR